MFDTILVANRGEIACRVIRTAKAMGIRTVAVHSDADRRAEHVSLADEAIHIGANPASESYLDAAKILQACRASGAQAVHPGYGFLSERASFCELLQENGLTFIGPAPEAIRVMGDKIRSKQFAEKAGVNIVPGHLGIIESAEEAERIAEAIGYPVMIKASAGGGGKGMRVARDGRECRDGFDRARSEAGNSFGDDRVFIEKFVEQPRHIEIQVLADAHGNVVHLGERECSIQRRNQKVVEEAPSSFLDEATRAEMGRQAVALAAAVDYRSAGTVEFIVDKDRNFYFLEMNTRLQVEHPVTELVTGIDIVEEMIRIANGETLRLRQDDIAMKGWAIESRLYAEDPFRGFLPSIGRLTRYRPPREGTRDGGVTVRNDTGVTEGSQISMFYDPMIAKLCTHAATRDAAIDAMADALAGFEIEGIEHNVPFLSALMRHPRWRRGDLTTAFIAEEYPGGFEPPAIGAETALRAALIGLTIEIERKRRLDRHIDRLRPHTGKLRRDWEASVGGNVVRLEIDDWSADETARKRFSVSHGETRFDVVTDIRTGQSLWTGTIDGQAVVAQVRRRQNTLSLFVDGVWTDIRVLPPPIAALDRLMPEKLPPDTSKMLLCPMPGLVVSIAVGEGQDVKAGETLAIVEAMKMENVLKAERDLTVAKLNVAPGESLAVDTVIMEFQ